jgi:signal peptidase I
MVWFETILVVLTLLTGIIWLGDKLFFAKARAQRAGLLDEKEPMLVDYSRAFFPVLAVVLGLRSFVAEPFRIPSSSMMPSLLIGDFILVNKYAYGLRLPISNKKFLAAHRTTPTRTGSSASSACRATPSRTGTTSST